MAIDKGSLWAQIVRHRAKLIDGSAVLLLTCLVAFYVFEIIIFETHEPSAPVKPVTLDEVMIVAAVFCAGLTLFSMRRLREARREMAHRKAAEREARNLAHHDALTGLPNRRSFDEALRVAVASPTRAAGSHVLLMLDLNGFKRVNDLYGHPAGDDVLIQVGGRLVHSVRDGDLVARLGGDEFAVLAMHTAGVESATGLATRIMEALVPPITTADGEHQIGAAIGIALFPQDSIAVADLMRQADVALYRAKEEKRRSHSAMRFFEPAMDAQARERDQLERELRQAIIDRSISPFYQPLVALDGKGVVGFEAQPRWTSPVLGEITAERFITVAEDAGIIQELTMLLLEQACADAATWPTNVVLSFNVSGASLQDPLFGLSVMQVLTRTGLLPQRLELEITESALVRDVEAARTALDILRGVGVQIALDDFGTGYSSLYHLRVFKPDKIKIDRSFIGDMEHDPDSARIVQALIGLGSGLGAKITADGVETSEQRALLTSQGCDQGQGYLFSDAVEADDALRMVTAPSAEVRREAS